MSASKTTYLSGDFFGHGSAFVTEPENYSGLAVQVESNQILEEIVLPLREVKARRSASLAQ